MRSFFALARREGFRCAVCCSSFAGWPRPLYFFVASPLISFCLGGVAWKYWFVRRDADLPSSDPEVEADE